MSLHKVKVYRAPSLTVVPQIRLQGKWVEQAGFHIGDPIRVEACYGEIKISLDHNGLHLIQCQNSQQIRDSQSEQPGDSSGNH